MAQSSGPPGLRHGDIGAMHNLGHMYEWGLGVSKDQVKAAEFRHRAAKADENKPAPSPHGRGE